MTGGTLVLVAARNEAATLERTLAALASAFPGDPVWVADDGSSDGTAAVAASAGARVVSSGRRAGKGAAMTLAAREALAGATPGEGAGGPASAHAGAQGGLVRLRDRDP